MKKLFLLSMCMAIIMGSIRGYAAQPDSGIAGEYNPSGGTEDTFHSETVKVGWFESEGYFEKDKNGNLVGFGVDYLNAIAVHTGWKYEFVKSTREGCLEMLQNGKIHLMSPVREDLKLENVQVSDEMIGESYGYIYKLGNNFKVSYEEYSQFQKMIIGIERGSYMEKKLKAYCEKNGFEFYDIVYFDTLNELKRALAGKKIDAFVTDSFVNVENLKVIGRFSNGQVTFATSEQALLEELSCAMEEIKLDNPQFTEDLEKKYFSESSKNNLEYSSKEREFLSEGRRYKVALSTEQYPISYKATEESGHKGIAIDILKKMEYYSGISLELVYVDSYEEGKELLQKGEVDILGGTIISHQDINNVSLVDFREKTDRRKEYTTEFYDMDMAFIGPKGTKMESFLTIAVPPYMDKCISELESMYPKYEFMICGSDEECLNAVLNKEADAAVQSDLKINELTIYDKYKELQNLKFVPGNYFAAFTIWTEDAVLINIMNKTLKSISEMSLSTIENNNIQHIAMEKMTVKEFLQQYKGYIIILAVLIVALNVALLGYRKYKEEKKSKEKAYIDSVAHIGSMAKFRIDVEPILNSVRKLDYYMIAVDIDKFKLINDLYGYEDGDKVIAYIAGVLQKNAGANSFVARPNADYFVVLKRAKHLSEIEEYLNKVFKNVDYDIAQRNSEYRMILKAGIYKIREEDYVLSSIMDKADLTKNNIVVGHESSYALYSEEMRQKKIEDKKIENDMESALENGEFQVYLQPQVDLKTKKIVSAEALVRWIHPEKGAIPPFKFVPLFEKNGFISKVDYFVWEESIKTLVRWQKEGKIMVPLSINLSRVDIQKKGLVESILLLFEKYGLSPQWIKAELTESVCLENDRLIQEKMNQLKDFGLKIAIDDFGSGYSSLNLLKTLPIDILKIDKSFLEYDENMQETDEIVIRDVVELGKHLRMQIIVEGVETLEQSDFLENIGCDIAQGYYYGHTMTIGEFEELLKKNHEGEE